MKKYIFLLALLFALSACGTVQSGLKKTPCSNQFHSTSTKLEERVGVLLALKSEDCLLSYGCGSKLSLLAHDMQTRTVVLMGNVDESMNGKLIAVQGPIVKREEAGETLQVGKTFLITPFQTQPFLDQQGGQYISEAFGCQPYWDRTYSWALHGRQPYLTVRLTPSIGRAAGSMIKLTYDGLTGELKNVQTSPEDLNPCNT